MVSAAKYDTRRSMAKRECIARCAMYQRLIKTCTAK